MIFVDVFLKLKSSLNFFQVVVWWGWRLWNPSVAERKTNRLPRSGLEWHDLETFCFLSQGLLYASLEYSFKSGIPEFISTENILYLRHKTRWLYRHSFIWILQRKHLIILGEVIAEKIGWWESSSIYYRPGFLWTFSATVKDAVLLILLVRSLIVQILWITIIGTIR